MEIVHKPSKTSWEILTIETKNDSYTYIINCTHLSIILTSSSPSMSPTVSVPTTTYNSLVVSSNLVVIHLNLLSHSCFKVLLIFL